MNLGKTYSIGQVCELLKVEDFNLRYIEKALNLSIKRNEVGERVYNERDVENLKIIFELKEQGLNYKAIRKVLEHQEEIAATQEVQSEEGLAIKNENFDQFMTFFKSTIDESIEEKLNPKFEAISDYLDNLVKQNEELKIALEKEQERHFIELDRKLTKWREIQQEKQDKLKKEKEQKKNKFWFKRILRNA